MITPVFDLEDESLYPTWHLEEGGIVSLVVPNVGEVRMTPDKATWLAASLFRQAEYGRWAMKARETHTCKGGNMDEQDGKTETTEITEHDVREVSEVLTPDTEDPADRYRVEPPEIETTVERTETTETTEKTVED